MATSTNTYEPVPEIIIPLLAHCNECYEAFLREVVCVEDPRIVILNDKFYTSDPGYIHIRAQEYRVRCLIRNEGQILPVHLNKITLRNLPTHTFSGTPVRYIIYKSIHYYLLFDFARLMIPVCRFCCRVIRNNVKRNLGTTDVVLLGGYYFTPNVTAVMKRVRLHMLRCPHDAQERQTGEASNQFVSAPVIPLT